MCKLLNSSDEETISNPESKFTFPMSFMMNTLAWGMLEFENGYRLAGEWDNSLRIVKWGLDWLVKVRWEKYS